MHLLEFTVYRVYIISYVLVNYFVNVQEGFHPVANIVFQVINDKGKRNSVIDILSLRFIIALEVHEEIIFCRKFMMALDVVDELLEAMLADHIILDPIRSGLPFKVVQRVKVVVGCLPTWKRC